MSFMVVRPAEGQCDRRRPDQGVRTGRRLARQLRKLYPAEYNTRAEAVAVAKTAAFVEQRELTIQPEPLALGGFSLVPESDPDAATYELVQRDAHLDVHCAEGQPARRSAPCLPKWSN